MNNDNFTDAARIIDAHRENERWVGDGVKIECVCGHTSHATYDFSGPITEDKNAHRDAERMHAAHVAQVLAAQEPTDAEIEAAAEATCSGEGGCDPCFNWDDSVDGGCTYCTRHARAALSAARAARRDEEDTP